MKLNRGGLPVDGDEQAPYYRAGDQAALQAALEQVVAGVRSCSFSLDGAVQADQAEDGTVTLDGRVLELGVDYRLSTPSEIQLLGATCEDLQRAGRHSLDFARGARFRRSVACDADADRAQRGAMDFARAWGASERVVARVGTVVGELARNIARHASAGDVVGRCDGSAIHLVVSDRGPGIENLQDVMSGNYQSPSGLGLGLLGVKRIASTFDVQTVVGEGTTVTISLGLEARRRVSA